MPADPVPYNLQKKKKIEKQTLHSVVSLAITIPK
jgi:hypothetical protein